MKPESAAFLQKSGEFLAKAQSMLDHGWPDEAGRAAYLAGFHAAQALIFEHSGRVLTHSGVQTEFARFAKNDPAFATELRRFFGRSYNLKQVANYETGPGAVVSASQAEAALATANLLVATVTRLIH
jgi:uncharacterized protein (UPF0332 family)